MSFSIRHENGPIRPELLGKFLKNCNYFNSYLVLLSQRCLLYVLQILVFSSLIFLFYFSREDQSEAVHSGPVFQSLKRKKFSFYNL